jgi:glutaredoxin
LKAWALTLGEITYPLLADFWPHGNVADKFGVLRKDGKSERAIFLIDPQGIIRYIDIHDIDDQPKNEVLFAELAKHEPALAAKVAEAEKAEAAAAPEPTPAGGVVMYCTTWCPSCRRARVWLEEHKVPYTEVDIGKDRRAAAWVRDNAKGNETTPSFNINGTVIVDWDERKMMDVLKIS